MNNDLIKSFVVKSKERRRLEAELDVVCKDLQDLGPKVLDEMADAGIQSMRVDGCTVYTERKLWAKVAEGASKEDIVEALEAAGYGAMIQRTYNTNSVSALLREWDANGEPMPDPLKGKLEASEVFSAKVRMS